MRKIFGGMVLPLYLLCPACSPFYTTLNTAIPKELKGTVQGAEAQSCINAAVDENTRARSNRSLDISLIAIAALFAAGGTGMTTASGFVSDTQNNGQNSDTRQWVAGIGAVSIGVGTALLALRTALNFGELSNSQIAAAAGQASLAMQILDEKDPAKRDNFYAQCTQLITKPNSSFPGVVVPAPTPTQQTPAPGTSGAACTLGVAAGAPGGCNAGLTCSAAVAGASPTCH